MRYRDSWIAFVGLLTFWISAVQAEKKGGETLGIVKEKPTDGRFVKTDRGFMVPYTATIPNSEVTFEMVPIPGGKFLMGSPAGEAKRKDDEGPQVTIDIEPFWMAKYEITWSEYKEFMALHDIFNDFLSHDMRKVTDDNLVDAVTAPSNLYEPTFTFKFGDHPRQPAITMSQFAAKQYTKWLSVMSKQFYRLPSEAQWEYACRADTTTAYYFGDDPSKIGEHGWYIKNSNEQTNKVGQKSPNPWGLYDMHGNVAEWVLDEYSENGYAALEGAVVKDAKAIQWPTKLFPRVARGGSWEDKPERCRSASRMSSHDDNWRTEDPNFPQSPYWFTTSPATGVGFRIIRPLNPPKDKAERERYWKADLEEIWEGVKQRIEDEGRGAIGLIDDDLPKAIEELQKIKNNK